MKMCNSEIITVLFSIILLPILPFIHIILLRLVSPIWIVRSTIISCLAYLLVLLLITYCFVGLSSRNIIVACSMVGFFTFGYMEALSHVQRGFSMQILIDIQLYEGLTFSQVSNLVGKGHGIDWLVLNRVTIMESLGFVRFDDGKITLRKPGIIMGKLGLFVKQLLKLGKAG